MSAAIVYSALLAITMCLCSGCGASGKPPPPRGDARTTDVMRSLPRESVAVAWSRTSQRPPRARGIELR